MDPESVAKPTKKDKMLKRKSFSSLDAPPDIPPVAETDALSPKNVSAKHSKKKKEGRPADNSVSPSRVKGKVEAEPSSKQKGRGDDVEDFENVVSKKGSGGGSEQTKESGKDQKQHFAEHKGKHKKKKADKSEPSGGPSVSVPQSPEHKKKTSESAGKARVSSPVVAEIRTSEKRKEPSDTAERDAGQKPSTKKPKKGDDDHRPKGVIPPKAESVKARQESLNVAGVSERPAEGDAAHVKKKKSGDHRPVVESGSAYVQSASMKSDEADKLSSVQDAAADAVRSHPSEGKHKSKKAKQKAKGKEVHGAEEGTEVEPPDVVVEGQPTSIPADQKPTGDSLHAEEVRHRSKKDKKKERHKAADGVEEKSLKWIKVRETKGDIVEEQESKRSIPAELKSSVSLVSPPKEVKVVEESRTTDEPKHKSKKDKKKAREAERLDVVVEAKDKKVAGVKKELEPGAKKADQQAGPAKLPTHKQSQGKTVETTTKPPTDDAEGAPKSKHKHKEKEHAKSFGAEETGVGSGSKGMKDAETTSVHGVKSAVEQSESVQSTKKGQHVAHRATEPSSEPKKKKRKGEGDVPAPPVSTTTTKRPSQGAKSSEGGPMKPSSTAKPIASPHKLTTVPASMAEPTKKSKGDKAKATPLPKPAPSDDDEDDDSDVSDAEDGEEHHIHLHGFTTDEDSSDEDDAMGSGLAVDVTKLPTIAKDDEIVKKKLEKAKATATEDRGVIFLGRLPHGFYEDQLKAYFSQFGTVTRLRVSRNKKTGKSKHYGFLEFDSSAVAQIVAETMDNYLLMGHILRCKVIPKDEVHPELWVGANRKWRPVPRDRITRVQHNKPRTEEQQSRAAKRLLKRQQARKRKLAEAGIEYDMDPASYKKPKETDA